MNDNFEMTGKVDVSLYGVTIPAQFISDEGVVTTVTETVREIPTMAGIIRVPTGIYEEAMTVFTLTLPTMDFMKNVLPDLYTAGTTGNGSKGRIAIGGNTCIARVNTPLVVHYTCESDSRNDIYLPNASIVASFEITQNPTDPVTVSLTANAAPQATTGVLMYLGSGSLTARTLWNPVTKAYTPVGS